MSPPKLRALAVPLMIVLFGAASSDVASPAEAVARAKEAGERSRSHKKPETILRAALVQWPRDPLLESYLGAILFSTKRIDESYDLLGRVCAKSGHEGACSVTAGIDLVRGRWEQAFSLARAFKESDCQKSDRLWILKQLATRDGDLAPVVRAAERLVRVRPMEETSYLFLAAAQWRSGQQDAARKVLADGRAASEKAILLSESVNW